MFIVFLCLHSVKLPLLNSMTKIGKLAHIRMDFRRIMQSV